MPDDVEACLFDLDGVLTKTAKIHAEAWKETFDEFLRRRASEGDASREGERFAAFDRVKDYERYVDGKPRDEGVRSFLRSRGIEAPEGTDRDSLDAGTVGGIGKSKNWTVLRMIRERGVESYEGSVRYVRAVREAGLRRAVVSSSANCAEVLRAAGIDDLFEQQIDGVVAAREHLKGKPAPDTFLAGARYLGVAPGRAAVFEDAIAGVEAGRAGGFRCVVGVDRVGHGEELREHGADLVVRDLAELLER